MLGVDRQRLPARRQQPKAPARRPAARRSAARPRLRGARSCRGPEAGAVLPRARAGPPSGDYRNARERRAAPAAHRRAAPRSPRWRAGRSTHSGPSSLDADAVGQLQREACLAASARARHGQKPGAVESSLQPDELGLAADERSPGHHARESSQKRGQLWPGGRCFPRPEPVRVSCSMSVPSADEVAVDGIGRMAPGNRSGALRSISDLPRPPGCRWWVMRTSWSARLGCISIAERWAGRYGADRRVSISDGGAWLGSATRMRSTRILRERPEGFRRWRDQEVVSREISMLAGESSAAGVFIARGR